jgi:Xaa-Pro aminopeptidase
LADTFAVRHALPPEDPIDVVALRRYRLRRVRDEMAQRSIDACILLDPVSIRYACGARNMHVEAMTARSVRPACVVAGS